MSPIARGKLVRAAFMIPAPFDNTYAYANEGTRIALPRGYTAYHLNSSTGTTITNPYAIAAGTGDFSVYMEGIGTWEAVGAGQDEATLRTTAVVGSNNGYALSGSGSEADPYVISTPEALAWYAYKVNQHSRTNIVTPMARFLVSRTIMPMCSWVRISTWRASPMADWPTSQKPSAADKYANVLKWIPIDQYYPRFDGKGHTVDHLYMNSNAENQGLFGSARKTDTEVSFIRNTSIGSASYVQGISFVGALVGSGGSLTITNCTNAAKL